MGKKLIYKKTLAMDLVKKGHDIDYTAKNRNNGKYQVYFFEDSPTLRKDLAELTGHRYEEKV
ncbi:hypothetical protein [Rossellomorea sp. FM04394]|uniref:hypothetical protein n=1 Tax=Rossellomorea sp. FM04394 TaxID=3243076 RepID=UPI0035A6FF84